MVNLGDGVKFNYGILRRYVFSQRINKLIVQDIKSGTWSRIFVVNDSTDSCIDEYQFYLVVLSIRIINC